MGLPCSKEAEMRKQMALMSGQLAAAQEKINALEAAEREREMVRSTSEEESQVSRNTRDSKPRLLHSLRTAGHKFSANSRKPSKESLGSDASASSTSSVSSRMLTAWRENSAVRETLASAHMGLPDLVEEPHKGPKPGELVIPASTLGRL
mmetsp:Transcript_98288/g.248089  ORF Transcript_98288/g.248089 Transcript_98288/m.248089 type:complete len:150 (+) Transcript_98288:107-556(+)